MTAARSEIDPARLRDSVAAERCPIPLILELWRYAELRGVISPSPFLGNFRDLRQLFPNDNVLYHSLSELAIHNGVGGRWADKPVLVQVKRPL
jgi:hypothetical protein